MIFPWLAALALLQQPAAPVATPVRISEAQFRAGHQPAALVLPAQGYTTSKSGVQVARCPLLKSSAEAPEYLEYSALGSSSSAPNLFFTKATGYNGYFVVVTNRQTCQSYALTGYPLLHGSTLVCFNDEETTDVQDAISVWHLTAAGKLTLRKKIPLPKNQIHYDPGAVRFSPDGQRLYYRNTAQQYVAVVLGN